MEALTITEGELLAALAAAAPTAPDGALTAPELAEATGLTVKKVREALRAFAAQGRLGVHQGKRPALDGRLATVPVYTIKPVPRATKKKPAKRRG